MKCRAVVFDLAGTLIQKGSTREWAEVTRQMASVLGAPPEGFVGIWRDTYRERGEGIFESIDANIEHICGKLGVSAGDAQIGLAAEKIESKRITPSMS